MFQKQLNSQADLAAYLIKKQVLKSPQLIAAFKAIDRRDFVLGEFWEEAYQDYPLSIGYGQTISQPWTVAFMLELLAPQPGERILDIGSGSGWTTALLAEVVSQGKSNKKGKVLALELIPQLCEFGRDNCAKYDFVNSGIAEFHCQNAVSGLSSAAPFDRILVSAKLSTEELPSAWQEQLRLGGRLVTPIKDSLFVFDKISQDSWEKEKFYGFSFVPLKDNPETKAETFS